MNTRNVRHRIVRAGRLIRAFTLIEMLICVGAVALISVGLGKLFSATGDTVKIGKRISYMNEVAGSLERQIRRDLGAATRDGPMVIRHKEITDASNPAPNRGVYLTGDRNPLSARARRADEIVFLAQGRFASAREPLWPGRIPSSSVARVYIGHGMKSSDYSKVRLDTDPTNAGLLPGGTWPAGLGMAGLNNAPGPNQFASDWILLRHITVLARPQQTQTQLPNAPGLVIPPYLNAGNWKDSPAQIELQPAAPSVFRFDPVRATMNDADRLGHGYELWNVANPPNPPTTPATKKSLDLPTNADLARLNDGAAAWPQFASGLVDVASIDPQMIRTRILGTPGRLPWDSSSDPAHSPKMYRMNATTMALQSTAYDFLPGAAQPANFNSAHPMKMFMAAMLPGADPWISDNVAVASPINPISGGGLQEQRMLCAPVAPDFTGNLSNNGTGWAPNEPYHQQDQAMLSASNFAVGCSEFRIEWSFGDVYSEVVAGTPAPAALRGQIIWHDLEHPYFQSPTYGIANWPTSGRDVFNETWTNPDGSIGTNPVQSALIHWPISYKDRFANYRQVNAPLYSFFGYLDPTYQPPPINPVTHAQTGPDTVEWPWPKLLRFTISLTDPVDPNVEQTFQFVVDLPAANRRQ